MDGPFTVLVHGAGHTATVWRDTQEAMANPTIAVDLPGRRSRPADITTITVADAADAVAQQIDGAIDHVDVVLVGHSVAGTILPSVAARLDGRVRHLVFVAGITAPEGVAPVEVFGPDDLDLMAAHLDRLRSEHTGSALEDLDVKTASGIDSLNFSSQPMQWCDLHPEVPRTFVRCLRDPIQSRELQAAFAVACGANEVIDVDTGHTPAVDAPEALAALLDRIVDSVGR